MLLLFLINQYIIFSHFFYNNECNKYKFTLFAKSLFCCIMCNGMDVNYVTILNNIVEALDDYSLPETIKNELKARKYLRSKKLWRAVINQDSLLDIGIEEMAWLLVKQYSRRIHEKSEIYIREANLVPDDNFDYAVLCNWAKDEEIQSYIVKVIKYFLDQNQSRQLPVESVNGQYNYIFEIVQDLKEMTHTEKYYAFCHIGDYTLYLTGAVPEWVKHRHEYKNRPMQISDYRKYGQQFFNRAAKHPQAQKNEAQTILKKLQHKYDETRFVLYGALHSLKGSQ